MFVINRQSIGPSFFLRRMLAKTIALTVASVLLTATVSAQRYKTIPPKLEPRAAKTLRGQVANAMRSAAVFESGGKENIDRYYKRYYFPKMTQYTPSALSVLGKVRENLVKQLRGSTVPAAQTHLTQLTLGVMRALARDNYHPAVRYNATLLLGTLDKKYPAGGANPAPPEVLSAGTNELLELLEQQDFDGVKVHPSVQVGALEGLERHVRYGLDPQYAGRVTQASMAVVAQESADQDVDTDVNNWMKCQAARVLAGQFQAGPSQEVQRALTKLIASDSMSLEDRCCIVSLLGKIEYAGAAEADVTATLLPLGLLTKAVVTEGAEKAKEFEDLVLGNNPGGGRINFGGRRGKQGPKLERRQLLSRLKSIADGATSLSKGLPADQQQQVQSLTGLLLPVIRISALPKELDLDVTGEVIKLENTIHDLVASWQPAPAAAEATDADFAE